jgi:hypothetical protein
MGEFRFESVLPLVERRHDTPHGTVASPHLGGKFDDGNILRNLLANTATLQLDFFLYPVTNLC